MKVALTNLSNAKFEKSRLHLNKTAKQHGVDKVFSFDFETDIKNTPFYTSNEPILSQSRGLGYWLWKPYIILKAIESLEEEDILIYSDCGIEITGDLKPLISICKDKENILLFSNRNYINAQYTKRDCFLLMNCDHEKYWYSMQCDAAFMLFKKCNYTLCFLNEWMEYCKDSRIITDFENTLNKENFPGFIEHRHDQSVISLLAEKYNINLYRMPTHYNSNVLLPVKPAKSPKGILTSVAVKTREFAVNGQQHSCSCSNSQTDGGIIVHVDKSMDDTEQFKYNYLLSYLDSTYGKLLNHHRKCNIGLFYRMSFRIKMLFSKALMKTGYRLEKIA
jgi:hypothetical protein